MTSFRIRPRFRMYTRKPQEIILQEVKAALNEPNADCTGVVIPGHITLKIPATQQHFWSPQLDLTLEEEGEQTLIRGLYGPNPNVWSLFAFSYLALGILLMFLLVMGFSAYSLNEPFDYFWAIPAVLAAGAGIYLLSQMGQKLGAEQTFILHHFIERVVGQKVGIR